MQFYPKSFWIVIPSAHISSSLLSDQFPQQPPSTSDICPFRLIISQNAFRSVLAKSPHYPWHPHPVLPTCFLLIYALIGGEPILSLLLIPFAVDPVPTVMVLKKACQARFNKYHWMMLSKQYYKLIIIPKHSVMWPVRNYFVHTQTHYEKRNQENHQ